MWNRKKARQITVRCGSAEDGCRLMTKAVTGLVALGLKSLAARRAMGLPDPVVDGVALRDFLTLPVDDEGSIEDFAVTAGFCAGMGCACQINRETRCRAAGNGAFVEGEAT